MSSIDREGIFQEVIAFIDRSAGSEYNLADLLLSPIYLDAIQRTQISHTWKKKLVHFVYKARRIFRSGPIPQKTFDIILWPAEYSHINQMSLVHLRLEQAGFRCIWIANKKKVMRRLRTLQYDFYYVPEPYSVSLFFMLRLWRKHITHTGHHKYNTTICRQLPIVAAYIQLANKLINNVKPVGVLVGNDLTPEGRVATQVFKRAGIYTACIQHGDMTGPIHSRHIVHEFFVYGKRTLESLPHGVSDTRFLITGAPYLEHPGELITKSPKPNSSELRAERPYIMVALSGPGNNTSFVHHQQLVEAIFKLADQIKTFLIIIKLHPKDRPAHYAEVGKRYPGNHLTIIPHNADRSIFDWLRGSTLLITGASTTALEAMYLGIPVISVDLMNEYSSVPFIKNGATAHVRSYDELEYAVRILSEITTERKDLILKGELYVTDYFCIREKKSSELIAESIMQSTGLKANMSQSSVLKSPLTS